MLDRVKEHFYDFRDLINEKGQLLVSREEIVKVYDLNKLYKRNPTKTYIMLTVNFQGPATYEKSLITDISKHDEEEKVIFGYEDKTWESNLNVIKRVTIAQYKEFANIAKRVKEELIIEDQKKEIAELVKINSELRYHKKTLSIVIDKFKRYSGLLNPILIYDGKIRFLSRETISHKLDNLGEKGHDIHLIRKESKLPKTKRNILIKTNETKLIALINDLNKITPQNKIDEGIMKISELYNHKIADIAIEEIELKGLNLEEQIRKLKKANFTLRKEIEELEKELIVVKFTAKQEYVQCSDLYSFIDEIEDIKQSNKLSELFNPKKLKEAILKRSYEIYTKQHFGHSYGWTDGDWYYHQVGKKNNKDAPILTLK